MSQKQWICPCQRSSMEPTTVPERESALKNWQAQGLGCQSAGNVLTPLFISLLYSNLGLESEGGSKWGQRTEANPYSFP